MNSIDTIYEYAGYKLAGSLSSVFSGIGLPLILALAGLAYSVHIVAEKGTLRPLALHVLYLLFASWLLGTTRQQGVPAPRFIAYTGQATDLLQKLLVKRINDRFLTAPYEWERIAAQVSYGRILDPALDLRVAAFLDSCARTSLALTEPRHANLLREGALPYEGDCERRRRDLWDRLQQHVNTDPHHQATIQAVVARDPAQADAFVQRYTDALAIRSIDEPGGPISESNLVLASLGEYSITDRSQRSRPLPAWAKPLMGPVGWLLGSDVVDAAIDGLAGIHQEWTTRIESKQRFFAVLSVGPHVYGIAVMILLGLFPVAGMLALVPGHWRVLLRFVELYASVKLWPVGWAILSTFNQRRGVLETFDAPERGDGSVFLAVSGMYLLIPALAFMIVRLAGAAAAIPFAPAVPPAAGPGLGAAGPVVNVTARMIR